MKHLLLLSGLILSSAPLQAQQTHSPAHPVIQPSFRSEIPMPQPDEKLMPEHLLAKAPKSFAPLATTGTQLLQDSVVTYQKDFTPSTKNEFTYDADGHCLTEAIYAWSNENNHWSPTGLYEYSYDAAGKRIEMIYSDYYNGWKPFIKQNYTYDERGNEISLIYSYYRETFGWADDLKYEYTYNERNHQTCCIQYKWVENDWVPSFRYEFDFDEQDHQILYEYATWSNDDWLINSRSESAYDENGHQIYYVSYFLSGYELVGNYKTESAYDDQGRQTRYASYYWDYETNEWVGNPSYRYAFNQTGRLTYYEYCEWRNGQYVPVQKDEYGYDDEDYQISYCYSNYIADEWVIIIQNKTEYTFDDNGLRSGFVSFRYDVDSDSWLDEAKAVWTYDDAGNRISEVQSYLSGDQWYLVGKNEYTFDAQGRILSETTCSWRFVSEDWQPEHRREYTYDQYGYQDSSIVYYWSGTEWQGEYKFLYTFNALGNTLCYEQYSYDVASGSWMGVSKYENICDEYGNQIGYHTYDKWKNGEWVMNYGYDNFFDAAGNHTGWEIYEEQDTWANDMTLSLSLTDAVFLNRIDEDDLLFAGIGFKIKSLYVDEIIPAEPGTEVVPEAEVYWVNDGSLGNIYWDGNYRFASPECSTGEECFVFSTDIWQKLKTETFYVDIEGSNPQIRVTTGWWTTNWTDEDIFVGNQYLTDNGDYTMTLKVNLAGSGVAESMDQQHLLFTGQNYRILRIRGENKAAGETIRHELWSNDGSVDFTHFDSVYRFGRQGHEERCLATFSDADWDLIKTGKLGVEIEAVNSRTFVTILTTGNWSYEYGWYYYGSPYIKAETVQALVGTNKWESTYDEFGNEITRTDFGWDWEYGWNINQITIYYYSDHDTDLDTILSDARARRAKELRNGKVIIVVDDKMYDLNGERLK